MLVRFRENVLACINRHVLDIVALVLTHVDSPDSSATPCIQDALQGFVFAHRASVELPIQTKATQMMLEILYRIVSLWLK